jgi:hypothetical protein
MTDDLCRNVATWYCTAATPRPRPSACAVRPRARAPARRLCAPLWAHGARLPCMGCIVHAACRMVRAAGCMSHVACCIFHVPCRSLHVASRSALAVLRTSASFSAARSAALASACACAACSCSTASRQTVYRAYAVGKQSRPGAIRHAARGQSTLQRLHRRARNDRTLQDCAACCRVGPLHSPTDAAQLAAWPMGCNMLQHSTASCNRGAHIGAQAISFGLQRRRTCAQLVQLHQDAAQHSMLQRSTACCNAAQHAATQHTITGTPRRRALCTARRTAQRELPPLAHAPPPRALRP